MEKATLDELSLLHSRVAKQMLQVLSNSEDAAYLLQTYKGELPPEVCIFLGTLTEISPAMLTVATKFLKDNSITVDPAQSEDLSDLQKRLKEKRKQIGNVIPMEIAHG